MRSRLRLEAVRERKSFWPPFEKLGSDEKQSRQVLAKSVSDSGPRTAFLWFHFNSIVNSSKSACSQASRKTNFVSRFLGKVDGVTTSNSHYTPFPGLGSLYS